MSNVGGKQIIVTNRPGGGQQQLVTARAATGQQIIRTAGVPYGGFGGSSSSSSLPPPQVTGGEFEVKFGENGAPHVEFVRTYKVSECFRISKKLSKC